MSYSLFWPIQACPRQRQDKPVVRVLSIVFLYAVPRADGKGKEKDFLSVWWQDGVGEGEFLFSLPHRRTRPRSGHDCRVGAAGLSPLRVSRRPCLRAQLFYGRANRRHVCGVETSPLRLPLPPAVPAPFWRLG